MQCITAACIHTFKSKRQQQLQYVLELVKSETKRALSVLAPQIIRCGTFAGICTHLSCFELKHKLRPASWAEACSECRCCKLHSVFSARVKDSRQHCYAKQAESCLMLLMLCSHSLQYILYASSVWLQQQLRITNRSNGKSVISSTAEISP